MGRLSSKLKNFSVNVASLIRGIMIGRSRNIVIVGAWMGSKFADNSRFLFQYLHDNKEKLHLKDVIWATRNTETHLLLQSLGYKSCMIGTKASDYWHLKAGIHILCNNAFSQNKYPTDIDTRFSYGAKKIQLWHGVGFKSVGFSSNEAKSKSSGFRLSSLLNAKPFSIFQSIGGWTEAYVVVTSENNGDDLQKVLRCRRSRLIFTGYARNCTCPKLLDAEIAVIETIKRHKMSIIYLPTFRSDICHYEHPLSDKRFVEFLNREKILWIEKPHSADKYFTKEENGVENILSLDASFDINTLYRYVDVVISDYSSAVFDGMCRHIPVIMYTPDLEDFENGDVGFLIDVRQYCKHLLAFSIDECRQMISEVENNSYFNPSREEVFKRVFNEYFDGRLSSMEEIWDKIVHSC